MSFIKKLIGWFIEEEQPNHTPSELAAVAVKPSKQKIRKEKEDGRPLSKRIQDDILKEIQPNLILNDIKELETSSHHYKAMRDDLVQELKKLAPHKRIS